MYVCSKVLCTIILHLSKHLHNVFIFCCSEWQPIQHRINYDIISHAMLKWTYVFFKVIFLYVSGLFVVWHSSNNTHLFLRCHTQTITHTHSHKYICTKSYIILNDRQSVKTCEHLICLGIKTGRQRRNLRQQSIPQRICLPELCEPNYYLQPAVSTERMNTFVRVLRTAWGATFNMHVFHGWIWGYRFPDENHRRSNYM